MIYSQFDWDNGDYLYFEDRIPASLGGWKPLTGLGLPQKAPGAGGASFGISIEDALPKLPVDAKPIGRGQFAKGKIVQPTRPSFLTAGQLGPPAVVGQPRPALSGWPAPASGVGITGTEIVTKVKDISANSAARMAFAGFMLGMTVGRTFGKSPWVTLISSVLGLLAFTARIKATQETISTLPVETHPQPGTPGSDVIPGLPDLSVVPSFDSMFPSAPAAQAGLGTVNRRVLGQQAAPAVRRMPRVVGRVIPAEFQVLR